MGIRWHTDKKGVKVFRREKNGKSWYVMSVGYKKEGETWIYVNKTVRFKDSPNIPNGTIVYVRDGFVDPDPYVTDGVERVSERWIALDYDYDGMTKRPKQTYVEMPELPDTFSAAEDEIPF